MSEQHIFLHQKEQDYFSGLRYSKRQYSYLLGRYCAKHAIAIYTNNPTLKATNITNGVFQQPIVYHPFERNVQVSISHTESIGAAIAFPEAYPMGIDVETVCPSKIQTIEAELSAAEQKLITMCSYPTAVKLTLLWTLKEALSKVLKCGFMVPLELLEIKNIIQQESCVLSSFKNFHQYQGLSFFRSGFVFTIVYPKNTALDLDTKALKKVFGEIVLSDPNM